MIRKQLSVQSAVVENVGTLTVVGKSANYKQTTLQAERKKITNTEEGKKGLKQVTKFSLAHVFNKYCKKMPLNNLLALIGGDNLHARTKREEKL